MSWPNMRVTTLSLSNMPPTLPSCCVGKLVRRFGAWSCLSVQAELSAEVREREREEREESDSESMASSAQEAHTAKRSSNPKES